MVRDLGSYLPLSAEKPKQETEKILFKKFNTDLKNGPHFKKKIFLSDNLATIESVSWRGWRAMAGHLLVVMFLQKEEQERRGPGWEPRG